MFTVVGEALLDMVQPGPGDLYRALPAGGPLNIAIGLRRLGHPTALMARVSRGALGQRVWQRIGESDLDVSGCVRTDERATLAFATVDGDGRAHYEFYVEGTADWGWTAGELARLPARCRVVHTGSLAASIEPGASALEDWWRRLRAAGRVLLSYDPNVRPALMGRHPVAVARVERFVAASHVVKASDEDLAWLYPDRSPAESLAAWAESGPALVVMTAGPDGCLARTAGGMQRIVPAPPIAVVDTIGAGDAFHAGLLSGLADAGLDDPSAISGLGTVALDRVLVRALDVAALTCARPGADPPTRAEYDQAASR